MVATAALIVWRLPAATLVLVAGLALSVLSYSYVHTRTHDAARASFEEECREIHRAIESRLNTYAGLLLGLRGMHKAAGGLALGDFRAYVRNLGLETQLPAVLVMGGAVIAAVGLLPRWASAVSWALLLVWLLLGPLFAPTFDLPAWLGDLSPFTHVPKLPGGDADPLSLLALTAVGVALGAAGIAAMRRRDVALPA